MGDRLKHLSISTSGMGIGDRRDRIPSDDLLIQDGHCLVSPAGGMETGLSLDKYGLDSPMGGGLGLGGPEPLPLLSPASSVGGDFSGCGLSPSVLRSLQEASPCGEFKSQVQSNQQFSSTSTMPLLSLSGEGPPMKTFGGEPTSVGMMVGVNEAMADPIVFRSEKSQLTNEGDLDSELTTPLQVMDSTIEGAANSDAATPPLITTHPTGTIISPPAASSAAEKSIERFSTVPDAPSVLLKAPPPPCDDNSSHDQQSSAQTLVSVCKLNPAPVPFSAASSNSTSNTSSTSCASSGFTVPVRFNEAGHKRSRGEGRMTPVEAAFSPTVLPSHKKAYQPDSEANSDVDAASRLRSGRPLYSATIAP